jgi:hypothetical protein
VSDDLKEKVLGISDETATKAKPVTGAKASVKRTVAKGGSLPPDGAKDTAPVGAKDGTLGAKD